MTSAETQNSKWCRYSIYMLRWLGVIPVAIAGSVILPVIIHYGNELAKNHVEERFPEMAFVIGIWNVTFGELVKSAVSGAVFVYLGMVTAPNAKTIVAGVLAVSWYMLQLYLITLERSSVWMLVNLTCSSLVPLFVFRHIIKTGAGTLRRS